MDVSIGVLAAFRDGRWRILITKRPENGPLPGLWELPGGKIKSGESPEQCLVREFAEELDLEIKVGRALPTIEYDYPHASVKLNPFYCTLVDHTAEPTNITVCEHRWITAEQITDYQFPPANKQLMRDIAAMLGQHLDQSDDQ